MNGILNIDKPPGRTSFDIVAMVKRLTGERRIGHAGTLDPTATGVLPVCLGQGTRIVQFLMETTKTYRAEIEFGVTTDTYDASGKVIEKKDPSGITRKGLESVLDNFRGLIKQIPPMYSAKRYHGKRLYNLARAGIEVERESQLAKIYNLDITDWRPPLATVEVACSKGTYIRSLAHDVGQCLGCGANLRSLIRLRYGPFDIKDAVSAPQFEDAVRYGYWNQFVYPIDTVLFHLTAIVVDDSTGQVIRNGQPVVLKNNDGGERNDYPVSYPEVWSSMKNYCRVYTSDGCFLGVLRFNREREQWQPEKVFL